MNTILAIGSMWPRSAASFLECHSVPFMNKIQAFGLLCKRWQSVGGEASHYGSHFLLLGLFFGQSRNKKKAE